MHCMAYCDKRQPPGYTLKPGYEVEPYGCVRVAVFALRIRGKSRNSFNIFDQALSLKPLLAAERTMSDPFSIASGAVGVISLGIQLCKHITEYAEGWRGYDEDIESIGLKAESLKGPLKQLRDLVEDTRLTDSETANNISNKVLELERCLKRLENRLAQAKPVISDSLKERLRNKLKKVAYPVRAQNALRDIKADLESIQATIQFALTM